MTSAETRAAALWLIVGGGLLYGIVNTVDQAVKLFTGG
jgi:hypothetical protein